MTYIHYIALEGSQYKFYGILYEELLSYLIQSSSYILNILIKRGTFEKGFDIILTGVFSLWRGIGKGLIPCFSCLHTKEMQRAYMSITIIHVNPRAAVFPAVGLLSDVGITEM